MKRFCKSIGIAILYLLFFVALQMAVQSVLLYMLFFSKTLPYLLTGVSIPSYASLINQSIDTFQAHLYTLTGLVDLIALILFALFFVIQRKNFFTEIHIAPVRPFALPWILLSAISLNVIVSYAVLHLPFPQEWQQAMENQSTAMVQDNMIAILITVIIIAPIFEEIFVRGLIYHSLLRGMHRIFAVIFSSLIFGLLHGNMIQFLYSFFIGILFCLLNDRCQSLLASIIAHIIYNAASLAVSIIFAFFPNFTLIFLAVGGTVFLFAVIMLIISTRVPTSKNAAAI